MLVLAEAVSWWLDRCGDQAPAWDRVTDAERQSFAAESPSDMRSRYEAYLGVPLRGRVLRAVGRPLPEPKVSALRVTPAHAAEVGRRSDDKRAPARYSSAWPRPKWIRPQLSKLATKAPSGPQWIHEIKLDGYRMAARIANGAVTTADPIRTRLDRQISCDRRRAREAQGQVRLSRRRALRRSPGRRDLIRTDPAGVGQRRRGSDLFRVRPARTRWRGYCRPAADRAQGASGELLVKPPAGVMFNDHESGDGEAFRRAACKHGLEGIVSKRADRPYLPDDRGAWIKTKCLNRAEFVVVGWTDPEGSRPYLGALLLGYYDMTAAYSMPAGSERACRRRRSPCSIARLKPLVVTAMPLAVAPPKETRFGGKLALSRVHWVRPELVVEITYLSWAEDGLLRHTVFVGLREDNRARSGARSPPEHAKRLPCVARNLPEEQNGPQLP